MSVKKSWLRGAWRELKPAEELMTTFQSSRTESKFTLMNLYLSLTTTSSSERSNTLMLQELSLKSMPKQESLLFQNASSCLDQKRAESPLFQIKLPKEPTCFMLISFNSSLRMDCMAKTTRLLLSNSLSTSTPSMLREWWWRTSHKTNSKLSTSWEMELCLPTFSCWSALKISAKKEWLT